MKRFLCAALAACVVGLLAAPVWAGEGLNTAVWALHVQAWSQKGTCGVASPIDTTGGKTPTSCSGFNTQFDTNTPADVYLVVAKVDSGGLAGTTFGIHFGEAATGVGVDVITWTPCTTGFQYPSDGWPTAPGTGNIITWNAPTECATQFVGNDGQHGVVGVFYIYAYSDDFFSVREHALIPSEGQRLVLANCSNENQFFDFLTDDGLGHVRFGTNAPEGCNPCTGPCYRTVPTKPATWGQIKTKYAATN